MSKGFIPETEIPKPEEKCPYCGETLGEDKSFCHKCGKYLGAKNKEFTPLSESKARMIRIIIGAVALIVFLVIYLFAKR